MKEIVSAGFVLFSVARKSGSLLTDEWQENHAVASHEGRVGYGVIPRETTALKPLSASFYRDKYVVEYLLLHYVGGHWGFPKGKIEPGESKQEAALRELKEETGLSAQIHEGFEQLLAYFFTEKGVRVHKTVHFLVAETTSKSVILSHEHIGFAWLPYKKALERLTFDNVKQVLHKADIFIRSL